MNINIQVVLHNYVLWAIIAHKRVRIVWLLLHSIKTMIYDCYSTLKSQWLWMLLHMRRLFKSYSFWDEAVSESGCSSSDTAHSSLWRKGIRRNSPWTGWVESLIYWQPCSCICWCRCPLLKKNSDPLCRRNYPLQSPPVCSRAVSVSCNDTCCKDACSQASLLEPPQEAQPLMGLLY